MPNIENEIEQIAEQLEKSTETPRERLISTIRQMGAKEIKARLATLEKSEKELLLSVLGEMQKGGPGSGRKGHKTLKRPASPEYKIGRLTVKKTPKGWGIHDGKELLEEHESHKDAIQGAKEIHGHTMEKSDLDALAVFEKAVEMDKNYAAKYVQGNIKDTKIQEDKADDDQDEKLVMKEAAAFDHQGTPTPGWEGQVIKGKKDMSKEEAKSKLMAMEEKEHGEKDPKKLVEAEKNEHKEDKKSKKVIKKGDMPFCDLKDEKKSKEEKKNAMKKIKKSVEDQLKEFGVEATPELVKGEMKRLLKEEDQDGDAPEMNEKTRANKEKVKALDLSEDNKEAQKKVNDEKQGMKKAIWGGEQDLLKANTLGRNFHFSMENHLNEQEKSEKPTEEVKKSEGEKEEDLNDIIAKSQDTTWGQLECDTLLKANHEKRGKVMKSFEENEIAQALGLTPEEAKTILGE